MSEKEVKDIPQEGEFKMKKKRGRPRKLGETKNNIAKVDLTKNKEDAVQEPEPEKVVLQSDEQSESTGKESKVELQEVGSTHNEPETVTEEKKQVESPIAEIIEEPVEEKKVEATVETKIEEPVVEQKQLPENIEKLVAFMEETGGTVEDYVRLNADYSDVDSVTLLREYYKHTKPHLEREEVDFVLEDNFSWDEENDDERTIKKKKLSYKEEIAKARKFLEDSKTKYYDEIKSRPSLNNEQKKAMDFFNRYNKEQEVVKNNREQFRTGTEKYFTNDFKGFEFSFGDKRFRYGVNNPMEIAKAQTDLSSFLGKFSEGGGAINDFSNYHKAIYAARNADTLAQHFYEQGKADGVKEVMAKSKNINSEPRPSAAGEVFINGLKVKAVNGVDSSKLKIKRRNKT
tara:strand:- start:1582 stop:2784 length:1203 start_codon:yes stop_codon:yes gene_type:complete